MKKTSSPILCVRTELCTGGTGFNGWPILMPWSGPSRKELSASFAPQKPRAPGAPAAQAVQLCRRLLGMPIPVPLLATVPKSLTERWLEATALNAMTLGQGEYDPHDTKLGTTRGSLSTFLLSRSWRYRLAELRVHLMNQDDILAFPLPTWLRYLYPIMRAPLWVWRHASRRR